MAIESHIDLNTIPEEDLLNQRICDLPLNIPGIWLEECIQQLYQELEAKGLAFKPVCYLAEEWLTPENEPVIGIPFYLAHPTLTRLERKMMLEAEGETKEWCMKLLRHETGHAISYAYFLHKKRKWQNIFGPSSREYPDTYRYRPYSKNYVHHLYGFYAQYHPDEDFVETFAVWLTPGLDWKEQYQGWKALQKLNYVDELMNSIKGQEPLNKTGKKIWYFKSMKITLRNFYKKKRYLLAEDFPDFHDNSLKAIFTDAPDAQSGPTANEVIRKYYKNILNEVALWTGERKYVINDLLKTIFKRCQQLNLRAKDPEPIIALRLTSYITTLIMNYLYTGWFRGDRSKRRK